MSEENLESTLDEARNTFLGLVRSGIAPAIERSRELSRAESEANILSHELQSWVDDANRSKLPVTSGVVNSAEEARSLSRQISTGRYRYEALDNHHNFDAVVESDASSHAALLQSIHHWNPPSVKTATTTGDAHIQAADALESAATQLERFIEALTEVESESDVVVDPERASRMGEDALHVTGRIYPIVNDLVQLGESISDLVAQREPIRQAKRDYVSAGKRAGLLEGRRAAVVEEKAESVKVAKLDAELVSKLNSLIESDELVYRSKKKLAESQREWNRHVRNLSKLFSYVVSAAGSADIINDDKVELTERREAFDAFEEAWTNTGLPAGDASRDDYADIVSDESVDETDAVAAYDQILSTVDDLIANVAEVRRTFEEAARAE